VNYLKKIKSLGFRKTDGPLVFTEGSWNADAHRYFYLIQKAETYYKKKIEERLSKIKNESVGLHYMGLSITPETIKKMTTHYLNLSNSTIYITIQNQHYSCFIQEGETASHSFNGILNENFWKDILSSLPTNIRRELILNDIL
jgi:hypothetical protein